MSLYRRAAARNSGNSTYFEIGTVLGEQSKAVENLCPTAASFTFSPEGVRCILARLRELGMRGARQQTHSLAGGNDTMDM